MGHPQTLLRQNQKRQSHWAGGWGVYSCGNGEDGVSEVWAQAKWAAGKPYCASCGWNVAEAKREVRKRGIAYTVLIVVLVGLMVVGFFSAKEPSMGAFLAGFMVLCLSPIIFFAWVWPWMRLRKVEKRIGLVGGSGAVMAGAAGGRTR